MGDFVPRTAYHDFTPEPPGRLLSPDPPDETPSQILLRPCINTINYPECVPGHFQNVITFVLVYNLYLFPKFRENLPVSFESNFVNKQPNHGASTSND